MDDQGTPSGQIVDPESIETLRELQSPGEPDVLQELITTFFDDSNTRLAALDDAVSSDQYRNAERAAHGLAGGAAVFGAERFTSVCREIQRTALSDDTSRLPVLVRRLHEEYEALKTALNQQVEQGR